MGDQHESHDIIVGGDIIKPGIVGKGEGILKDQGFVVA